MEFDFEAWPRRGIYEFFSGLSQPFYSVTFTLDVTKLYACVKRRGLSFYYALTWLVTEAVNSVPEFLLTIRGGAVTPLDRREPSFTDMKKDSECFHIVTMPAGRSMDEFCRAAKLRSASQSRFIDTESESDALIFISCLPWLELTSLTNERDFDRDDSVPRISWGRYTRTDGRMTLGMSVEVNHRLIDGVHIGRFAQTLEWLIDALD